MELSDLLQNRNSIKIKLIQLKKETLQLESELTNTEETIFQKCNHTWI